MHFIRHCRSLDISLPDIRQLLSFAARPDQSCAEVNALLDEHIALVRQRIAALESLEGQLASLRRTCDGDISQPCAILGAFMSAHGM